LRLGPQDRVKFGSHIDGLVRLSNALTRAEERLLRYIECAPRPLCTILACIPGWTLVWK